MGIFNYLRARKEQNGVSQPHISVRHAPGVETYIPEFVGCVVDQVLRPQFERIYRREICPGSADFIDSLAKAYTARISRELIQTVPKELPQEVPEGRNYMDVVSEAIADFFIKGIGAVILVLVRLRHMKL